MIFNIPYAPDWDNIEERKQNLINKIHQSENKTWVDHDYGVDEQILIYRHNIYHKL